MIARPLPFEEPAPRVVGTRAGRTAVARRRARARAERNAALVRVYATIALLTLAVVVYLALMANVTRLNYALAKSVRARAIATDASGRLDDEIARLSSRDRLGVLATRLGMHESQSFIALTLPHERHVEPPRGIALLDWLR